MQRRIQNSMQYLNDEVMQLLTETTAFIVALIMILCIGIIDWVTGNEIQFFVFYFVPITITGLKCSPLKVYLLAILSGISWYVSDLLNGMQYLDISYDIWNNFVRISAFFVIGIAVMQIRTLLEKERKDTSDLRNAFSEIKRLKELLPICSYCKKIRDDNGYWHQIEVYIAENSDAQFSHGACPECAGKVMKEMARLPD